jgi:PAS domain S-box-containing protein
MNTRGGILVVDDDPNVLFTTAQVLKAAGYQVTTAGTGRDGLRIAKEAAPFLMLLDVRLPDMSGFEVCRLAKSDPALAGMLVILISGTMTDSESRTEGLERGADAYLARPMDNRQLLAQIQAMWRIWQVESALRESREALRSDIAERKRTEDELANLGNRLNSVLDAATQVAIIATDPQGMITVFNSGAERMLGYRTGEMVGKQTPQAFHLESEVAARGQELSARCQRPVQGFDIFVENARSVGFEEREWTYVRKDGAHLTVSLSVTIVRNLEGTTTGYLGVATDITQRKQAEAQLRNLALVVQETDNLVVITDPQGRIEWVNAAFTRVTGYSLEEALGKKPGYLLQGKRTDPATVEKIREAIRVQKNIRTQLVNYSKSGREYWLDINIQPVFSNENEVVKFVAIESDITAQKLAEEELRKLSRAIEQSTATVLMTDRNGRIEYVNPHFTRLTGYTPEEARGKNPRILKSGAQPPEFYRELWGTLKGGRDWRGEFCNKKKNGEIYWESATISPIKNKAGEITHFVAVKEDITERKRVAEELQRAKEAAEAATRAKSAFLANMSHEIRTPMNAILGFSQLMLRDPALTPGQQQHLDTINRSGEHLLALINDILEMSKIEAGRVVLNPTNFDLPAMLDDLERVFQMRAAEKKLQLATEGIGELPHDVFGDEIKLRQILINLMGNAVKFTEQGGITLRVQALPRESNGFRLQMEIEDSGPGIAPQELGRLFQHFEQTHTGRQSGTGTGLGLAISREFARLMGGDITVTSRVGRGSIFRLEIPLGAAEARTVRSTTEPRRVRQLQPQQPTPRVLIADDNEENRELLSQMLGPIGFATKTVRDGQEAVREFQSWHPHLILIAMRMPVLGGGEVIRQVRSSAGGDAVNIICVSASAFAEDQRTALAQGADDFLSKPFREAVLLEKIRTLLSVDYVYGDEPTAGAPTRSTAQLPEVDAEALAQLPGEMIANLREVTLNGDTGRLRELLHQVAERDEALAQSLLRLVDRYDYDALIRLLTRKDS